jgi:DNA processing protein
MISMGQDLAEIAALVALLRRSKANWPDITLDVQDNGAALPVWHRVMRPEATLFSDQQAEASAIEAASAEIAAWAAAGIRVLGCFDQEYPAQLRDIREMPPILFCRGVLQPDLRAVAVVGSREASDRGLQIAQIIASGLASQGITVVSGLAKGIDTAAHRAALASGGRTVAVIGTGIRRYYPDENRSLQDRISERGLVVSQFWPDSPPSKTSFPMRNAVMSGYAGATVVVEAGSKSGARIQARLALQHGRPVILTDQVMRQDWARAFADNPGVHVAQGIAELLETVDMILQRSPANLGMESFPELTIY